jgi:hypothetical protein
MSVPRHVPPINDGRKPPFTLGAQLVSHISVGIQGNQINLQEQLEFLQSTLNQDKTENVGRHLGQAGSQGDYRPLHEQFVYRRRIVVTEDPSLHLVTDDDIIFIQPLQQCLTNVEFFDTHLVPNAKLYRLACGFLYSYTKLIKYRSDWRIANDLGLIQDVTWEQWQAFKFSLQTENCLNNQKRYKYGELRLEDLNNIIAKASWPRYSEYHPARSNFFSTYAIRYAAILAFTFTTASLTLSAMQVSIQQPGPSCPEMLSKISFWFSVSIMVIVGCAVILMLWVVWLMAIYPRV